MEQKNDYRWGKKRSSKINSNEAEVKKMNSKSFDIQSIYAMKNVYFICFWSETANILCIK